MALGRIGVWSDPLGEVDRLAHADRDLGRQREAGRQVEECDAERRAAGRREHLQAQPAVEPERARSAARDRGTGPLPAADGDNRDDRDLVREGEPDEAGPVGEVDAVRFPARPERLAVAAGLNQTSSATPRLSARKVFSREAGTRPCRPALERFSAKGDRPGRGVAEALLAEL